MIDLTTSDAIIAHDIRLVFFDIDGTLLNEQGDYSQALKQQIHRLHRLGIKTAIASGRPSYAAQFLFDELAISDLGVFCTGAEVYHPKEQRHLNLHTLDLSRVQTLYERIRGLNIYCEFYTTQYHTRDKACDISQIHSQHLRAKPRYVCADQMLSQSVTMTKLLLGRKKQAPGASLREIACEFPDMDFAFAHFLARPEWEFASVISHAADKHAAFEQVLAYYQLQAHQVMSIGDSHSDKIFIEKAGVGVAMGNALDDVKRIANYTTRTANDDGAAYALEKLITS